MKKLIFLIFLFPLFSFGQVPIWLKQGLNSTSFSGGNVGLIQTARIGILAGIFTELRISDRLAFQPELIVQSKQARMVDVPRSASRYFNGLEIQNNYLELPLLMKIKVAEFYETAISVYTGASPSFNIWSNTIITSYQVNDSGPDKYVPHQRYNANLLLGLSMTISYRFNVDLRYEQGLNNALGYSNEVYKNKVYSISMAFLIF